MNNWKLDLCVGQALYFDDGSDDKATIMQIEADAIIISYCKGTFTISPEEINRKYYTEPYELNKLYYDIYGYDKDGFDKEGFNREGFDKEGFDRSGYNKDGFDREGFNKEGVDKDGFHKDGFNDDGIDREGYNRDGFNQNGVDRGNISWKDYAKQLSEKEEKLINGILCTKYGVNLHCIDCSTQFFLSFSEIDFYESKAFFLPKRCKSCKDISKKYDGMEEAIHNKHPINRTGREKAYGTPRNFDDQY